MSKQREGQRRHEQKRNGMLGMSHAVAMKRLYRMIILRYMQQQGHDKCFKCGKSITTIDELSIEHKEPWFNSDNPEKTFWDMDNLAFSHIRCNVRHVGHIAKSRPEGTEWCSRCKQYLPLSEFPEWNNSKQRRTVMSYCFDCKKAYGREYMREKRAKIKAIKAAQSLTDSSL